MQLQQVLQKTTEFFKSKGFESARLDAELLLGEALSLKRIDLYIKFEQPLTEAELVRCRELVRRRSAGEPVAYILGYKDFYKGRFEVSPAVLIPRPETEKIVDMAVDFFRPRKEEALRILDLGTGSGCLGLSILCEFPNSHLLAVDVSNEALEVARRNAEKLEVSSRTTFVCSDAGTLSRRDLPAIFNGAVDLIIANPPYIAVNDEKVSPQVKQFEPHLALFGGPDGLLQIERWSQVAAELIDLNGLVLFEIGSDQGATAQGIFATKREWLALSCEKDLAGLNRVIKARAPQRS